MPLHLFLSCINEKCTSFWLCRRLICWQGGQKYGGIGFPLLLPPQFQTKESWRCFLLCHHSIPFHVFPITALGKGLREISVGVASLPPFSLHWHRSLPCFIITHFQYDIWFSLLAEQIYGALYAMLVLLQNKQTKTTTDFLKK